MPVVDPRFLCRDCCAEEGATPRFHLPLTGNVRECDRCGDILPWPKIGVVGEFASDGGSR